VARAPPLGAGFVERLETIENQRGPSVSSRKVIDLSRGMARLVSSRPSLRVVGPQSNSASGGSPVHGALALGAPVVGEVDVHVGHGDPL